jgi:hypothetical protein
MSKNQDKKLICIRCGRPVLKNKDNYETFEKMHWICFHFEYEHTVDSDEPCNDPSCPWWHLEIYKNKLIELNINPEKLIENKINERFKYSK